MKNKIDFFVLGDYEFAKNILDSLDHQRANISHWNRRGGFARQYIELLITFEKITTWTSKIFELKNTIEYEEIS